MQGHKALTVVVNNTGSAKKRVCSCGLRFDGVGEKRTGDLFRAGKNATAQTQIITPVADADGPRVGLQLSALCGQMVAGQG